jgi:hypothetical protein
VNALPNESSSLASLIKRVSSQLTDAGPGTLAELRRLRPDDPGGPAFWRVVVTGLEPELPAGDARSEALRRWAVILRALAYLHDLHTPGCRLGTARPGGRLRSASQQAAALGRRRAGRCRAGRHSSARQRRDAHRRDRHRIPGPKRRRAARTGGAAGHRERLLREIFRQRGK